MRRTRVARHRTVRIAALSVAFAVFAAACVPEVEQVSPTVVPTTPVATPTDPAPSGELYGQELNWQACEFFQCATVQVPLDWSHPEAQTIEVELARHRAGSPEDALGSLLINPGGPGSSGIDFLEYFVSIAGTDVLDHYNIVAFDPRGVARSTPVECGGFEVLDDYFLTDVELETADDVAAERQRIADFAQACREASGPLVENVDTVSAARDMDVIRAAVGDPQLNMLGYSYGSQLALTYAELYPESVGRIVLDGAVDPLLDGEEMSKGQAGGFEDALTAFLEWCVSGGDCPLGNAVEAARTELQDLLATARTEGYPVTGDRDLNGNLMVYGIVVTLYSEDSWDFLEMAIDEIMTSGRADTMSYLANFYLDRDSGSREYFSNSMIAFQAIGCLDDGAYEGDQWGIEDVRQFREEAEELSPTFGWWFAAGLGCDGWPFAAEETLDSLDNAATADPMLIVGTRNDPATPLKWAESLAERLEMPLLIFEGEGHTAYGRSNQCVVDVVDAYLVEGTLPSSGTSC